MDVAGAGKEEALADWEVGEAFLFFFGEFEDVGKDVHGGAGLFEQELHGRVSDDGAAHFAAHEILNVLGDGGETKVVFAGALGETEEEVGRIVVFHELPGLVNDKKAAFLLGADNVPDVGKDNIHGDGAEFILKVADVKDDHGIVDVDVGLLGEDASEGAGGVFAEALSELGTGAAHMEQGVVEVDDGGRDGLVGERVAGDAGAGVGINEGLVKVGFFVGGESGDNLTTCGDLVATEHEAEETVEGDKVGAEGVIGVFGVDDLGEIEGVNADVGVEGETDVAATDGIAEFLVFVFGVDNDDLGTNHHGAESFKLDGERFTSTRLSKDDEVGVF